MSYDPFARGSFPVGVRTLELRDESRGGRRVTVEVWYPASEAYRGQDLDDATRDRFLAPPGMTEGRQDAVRGAEPAEGRFPLILHCHGANAHRLVSPGLCTHLASHGYAVASPDFLGDNVSDLARDFAAKTGTRTSMPLEELAVARPLDAMFLIDSLLEDVESALAGLIDSERIGSCGVSFGGWTSLALNAREPRMRAAFPVCPAFGKRSPLPQISRLTGLLPREQGCRVPTFLLTGERDPLVILADLRELYQELPSPKRFAVLKGAGHMHWAEGAEEVHEWFRRMYLSGDYPDSEFDAVALAKSMGPFSEHCPAWHALDTLYALCLAHMDAHLRSDAGALAFLDGDLARTFAARGISLDEVARETGSTWRERMVKANGIDICTEAFGDPADPALLLIQGANASMIRWEDDLCQQLAAGGLYVIRYDNRDTGRSTAFTPYQPPYTLVDMANDAVGVLDAYGIERAHLAGASSGGMIVQLVAIHHPERVLSITPIISTPGIPEAAHAVAGTTGGSNDLPMPTPGVFELIQYLKTVDWTDEAAAAEAWVVEARALAGSRYPIDEAHSRALGIEEIRRARNLVSLRFNHPIAEHQTASWRHRLHEIKVPALVIAGAEDPVLPLAHSAALAREIPGAKLLTLDGTGHEVPRGAWDAVVTAILAHTNVAQREVIV